MLLIFLLLLLLLSQRKRRVSDFVLRVAPVFGGSGHGLEWIG